MKSLKIKSTAKDGDVITAKDLQLQILLGGDVESINVNFKRTLILIDGSSVETSGNANYSTGTNTVPLAAGITPVEISEADKVKETARKAAGDKAITAIRAAVATFIADIDKLSNK